MRWLPGGTSSSNPTSSGTIGTIDLIEQGPELQGVLGVAGGQRRRGDLSGFDVRGDVPFTQRPSRAAVLLE